MAKSSMEQMVENLQNQGDFMRREVFLTRLDEFSGCSLAVYSKVCKKMFLKYGLKSWDTAPEQILGKIFKDMRKALQVGSLRASTKKHLG